jgi:hypothetical protein
MDYQNETFNEGFDRLQRFLLAMKTGDELRTADAARLSGLKEDICRVVLEGLTRAGLMSQERDGRFVRRSLDVMVS